jgi:hypothetical protein
MNGHPDTPDTPLLAPEQIAVGILNEDRLSPDVGVFETMKQAVDTAQVGKLFCFELRHGELWSDLAWSLYPVVGQVIGVNALYRLLKKRFIVYLYKFQIDSNAFFITFKKREDKTLFRNPTPKIEEFGITLSQIHSSKNGDEYVAVPLKYDHASGVITYPYFVNTERTFGTAEATTTTEIYSTIRPQERSNMIITDDKTEQMNANAELVDSFMRAVDAIKKVNYGECLERQKRFSIYLNHIRIKQPHRDFDEIAQEFDKAYYDLDESVKFDRLINDRKTGGSAKKKKYTSRIISRKRRLSGKKGIKCRKSYKRVRSRKMARNARK